MFTSFFGGSKPFCSSQNTKPSGTHAKLQVHSGMKPDVYRSRISANIWQSGSTVTISIEDQAHIQSSFQSFKGFLGQPQTPPSLRMNEELSPKIN